MIRQRCISALLILLTSTVALAQTVADFGYRHLQIPYENDTVDVVIASEKGEELTPKPLFLFCQGSLPVPLIVYDDAGAVGLFPFDHSKLAEQFHLVIISKPGIPVTAHSNTLNPDFTFKDSTGNFPAQYVQNNHLDFYLKRNSFVIKWLQKNAWVKKDQLVVAGHSEGATIAAKMAAENKSVTQLIFASGNPLGRILSMIGRSRKYETGSNPMAENDFGYWEYLLTQTQNDSTDFYAQIDYSFSIPPMDYLKKLKIPVLVSYGSVDYSTPFNDYFRIWCMQHQKSNIVFQCYVGLEHNFFGTDEHGKPDYNQFNWDKVAVDWQKWLKDSTQRLE